MICSKCEEDKDTNEFHKNRSKPNGLSPMCAKCKSKYNASPSGKASRANWAKTESGRASRRKMKSTPESKRSELMRQRRIKYGLTEGELRALTEEQGGLCGGCGLEPQGLGPRGKPAVLCVDHDHATGIVRGLLCPPCNFALGLLRDSYETILGLAGYLKRSKSRSPQSLAKLNNGAVAEQE